MKNSCLKISSLLFLSSFSLSGVNTEDNNADMSCEGRLSLTQEEFEKLKKDVTQHIWNSNTISYMTRKAYMRSITTGELQSLIDIVWREFYETYQDPSGRNWELVSEQQYDLYGNIINII